MLKPKTTNRFEKDYKKALKSGEELLKLKKIMKMIVSEEDLPRELRDHKLIGNYQGRREYHITGDWLLIYKLEDDSVILNALDPILSCSKNKFAR